MTRLLWKFAMQLLSLGLQLIGVLTVIAWYYNAPPDLRVVAVGGVLGATWGIVSFVVKRWRRARTLRSIYPNPPIPPISPLVKVPCHPADCDEQIPIDTVVHYPQDRQWFERYVRDSIDLLEAKVRQGPVGPLRKRTPPGSQ